MRFIDYPGKGRPSSLARDLEELLVVTYAALESVNVERWALAFGAANLPRIDGRLRNAAYETEVVGAVHTLAQRYWERRGEAAVWERPMLTGRQGRPPAIDIRVFAKAVRREARLEFGEFTAPKLRQDSLKLAEWSHAHEEEYPHIESYALLWKRRGDKMTGEARKRMMRDMAQAASAIECPSVELLCVSGGDLFNANAGSHRWVGIGLFRIRGGCEDE